MTEFLVGLVVGALAMIPAWYAMREQRDRNMEGWTLESARTEKASEHIEALQLKLGARTYEERTGIEALLNRPDPVPEQAGRWLYDDSGLVQTFVPDPVS